MASDCIHGWLLLLEGFDKTDLGPLMVAVQTLRQKAGFLKAIMSYTGKWHIEDGNLKDLLSRIGTVISNVDLEFRMLISDHNMTNGESVHQNSGWLSIPIYLDTFLSCALERLELVEPQIQQVYTILSKYSRSISCMTDEAVTGHLQFLLENMKDLLRCKAILISPVKNELEAVQKSLRILRNFLGFAAKRCSELEELTDLLIHAEAVADNIACLIYLCCVNNKMDDQMISWMKVELLSQIQPEASVIYVNTLKASNSATCTPKAAEFVLGFIDSLRENLVELSENKLGFNFLVKDQILALYEELRFLECLVLDSPCEELADHDLELNELCEHNAALINETAGVIYSFYDDERKGMSSDRNSLVSDLLAKFKIVKKDARQIYDKLVPKSLRSNFPRTNAQGFISSLIRNLKQLLSSEADPVAPMKLHIEPVLKELLSLSEDLRETTRQPNEQEELEDHWTRFNDAAYQTECVIDSFLAKDSAIWFCKLGLFDVIEEIKTVRTGLKHLRRKVTDESTMLEKISSFPSQISLQTSPKDELVIFGHESEKIKEQLTNGPEKLHTVSIVGMPGIEQVIGQTLNYTDEDLDFKLYKSLRGRKYLIFLDDIWDVNLLGNISHSFPDDENGSRIMVTSRLDNIASQFGSESVASHLSPLTVDQSWKMLQFKVFGNECFPPELVEIGKKIAGSCRGLPLTIDLMAGVLKERAKKQDCWQQLAQSNLLTEFVDDAQARCRRVLELSYHHLPYHLRPCFLYFGGFPEDTSIRARWLERLWISEGFVLLAENDKRSLEDVAQGYMDQLISRSLIIVSSRGSLNGLRKSFKIHDLLRDFAIAKAKEEKFLLPIDDLSDFSTLPDSWFEQFRLFISADSRKQFTFPNPSGTRVRSLIFSGHPHKPTSGILSNGPINFSNFRLLRVFDVPDVHIRHISSSIFQLIHLRYLAVGRCEYVIFSAILHHMQNIETLLIIKSIAGIHELSLTDIENMARLRFLRHLKLHYFTFPSISQEIFKKPVRFINLKYLSGPMLRIGVDDLGKFMKAMPNLRKLKCKLGSSGNMNSSLKLEFPKNLESLSLYCRWDIISFLNFPPYLKKLTLRRLHLPWTNISVLGKLEHLEVLKFECLNCSKGTWDMVAFDKQFPKLKFLKLVYLDITEWKTSVDDLPFLERLQVVGCVLLEELPSCLAYIPTLQEISLTRCRNSAAISAKKIKEEQEELGNEQLAVNIKNIIGEDCFGKTYYEEGLSFFKDISKHGPAGLPYATIVAAGRFQSQKKRDEQKKRGEGSLKNK